MTLWLQAEFWRQMALPPQGQDDTVVETADMIERSNLSNTLADTHGGSRWSVAQLQTAAGSLLAHLSHPSPGIAPPCSYHEMLFSARCWRVQEGNLFAVYYHHSGACHTWYGLGAKHAMTFEKVLTDVVRPPTVQLVQCDVILLEGVNLDVVQWAGCWIMC
jgi:hypothetical protein